MASQLLYDNVDEMLNGCGMQANDVVAVILSSNAPHKKNAPEQGFFFHF
jgi:hypothetical protein